MYFSEALKAFEDGKCIARASWSAKKYFSIIGSTKNILSKQDIIAKDWVILDHWSDCAVYNEPAAKAAPCDCGGFDPRNMNNSV